MRQKLSRFAENARRKNVVEPGKDLYEKVKGNWNELFFKNENPLVVELGCGRGEYTVGLAQAFDKKNFIGVDIKGDRIWVGSSKGEELSLNNAAFLRTKIELLDRFFEASEIDEIWITFPDPRPKGRDEKRRLTSPKFIDLYKSLLKKGAKVNFKTDNTPLFDYTLETLKERSDIQDLQYTYDLYTSSFNEIHLGIKTKYEVKFAAKGEVIKFLCFHFKDSD